ncbi:NADH pyrophosphatase zinc ribbon domain-containing protein [Glutamicibacter sp. NPDC127525]|uniref:NADH pyrophosphatase zinc ribbon domain-containing protein n=1 Tax=unclassified Glutamicibacter TaxID=2627139 RepID=UPI00363D700A
MLAGIPTRSWCFFLAQFCGQCGDRVHDAISGFLQHCPSTRAITQVIEIHWLPN